MTERPKTGDRRGIGAGWAEQHGRRTATHHAAFFLPHLAPGMRLLDIGCGPGSITLGLAGVVAPGEAVGVDIDEPRLEEARALAQERGLTNVTFEKADAHALRFEDASFDAVFEHAAFQHLDDPAAAAREVLRVLKPGGVFGASDRVASATMVSADPDDERLFREFAQDLTAWRITTGSDLDFGLRLFKLFQDAGFSDALPTVSSEVSGDEESRASVTRSSIARYSASRLGAYVTAMRGEGAVDRQIAALARIQASPHAWIAGINAEVVGWKPL